MRDPDTWERWWDRNADEFLWSAKRSDSEHAITAASSLLTGHGRQPRGSASLNRAKVYTQIVPQLLSIVEQDDDPRVVYAALIALGRAIAPPFHDPLLELMPAALARDSLPVQTAATLALGLAGGIDGTATLIDLMSCNTAGHRLVNAASVPGVVCSSAALALGFGNDPAAVPALMDAVERLPSSENEIRTNAVMALGLMDNSASGRVASWLARKLSDRRLDPIVKSAIPVALARLNRSGAIEALQAVLADRDSDRWVVQSTTIAMGRLANMADDEALSALSKLVDKAKDGPTRRFALISLARIGSADTSPDTHLEAHSDLLKLLKQQVSHPDRKLDRPWAALAAGIYARGQSSARSVLADRVRAVYDDVHDPDMKGAYALSLGLMNADEAIDTLREDYIDVMSDGFRRHAAVALGLLGATSARDMLRGDLVREGAEPALTKALGTALFLLDDDRAAAVAAASFGETSSLQARTSLASSLGMLRDDSSIALLQAAAADSDLDVISRASAARALGQLVEKTTLPWYARLSIDSNVAAPRDTLAELLAQF
jgi:HEAT repeat protein